MDSIERPISDRAKALAKIMEDCIAAYHNGEECWFDIPRAESAIQQALDESFEDGISEYITTNPPRDR